MGVGSLGLAAAHQCPRGPNLTLHVGSATRTKLVLLRCGEFAIAQGSRCAQEPVQRRAELLDGRLVADGGQVAFCVVHCARQDVQVVSEAVELRSCDDQFAVAQLELSCSLAAHPVPLAAPLAAELLGAAGAGTFREHPPAPAAPAGRLDTAVV